MRRYETQERMTTHQVLMEYKCDRCGISAHEAEWYELIPVAIEVNLKEEYGRRDEYDYCNPCLLAIADVLIAAGSRAEIVTGVDPELGI